MSYPYLDTTQFLNLIDLLGSQYDPNFLSFDPENNQDAFLDWLASYTTDIIGQEVIDNSHTHNNYNILQQITSQGSGAIITTLERDWLQGDGTYDGLGVLAGGHIEILKNIVSFGSGQIISTAERNDLIAVQSHLIDYSNPHNVTASQIGANSLVTEINGDTYKFSENVMPNGIVFTTDLNNYYTKTDLQTIGSALVNWNNITDAPTIALENHTHVKADITDFAHNHTITDITDFAHTHDDRYYTEIEIDSMLSGVATSTHNHDDRYYTETELQTSGSALVHWDNITNAPVLADSSWKTPVSTVANLPTSGNLDGDIRVVLDEDNVYTWNATNTVWDLVGSNNYATAVHTHIPSDITGLTDYITAHGDVTANTLARHTHNNKSILDLITSQGSGDIITSSERNNFTTAYNHVSNTSNPHQIGMSGLVDMNANGRTITNLLDPVNPQDGVTKNYLLTNINNHTHLISDIIDLDLSVYYTKTELQTSGSALVHWNNITNVPNMAIEGHTHVKADITDFAHNHDDRYYTETELQTSGSSLVHWNNLTNVPLTFTPTTHSHTYSVDGVVEDTSALGGNIDFISSGLIQITPNNTNKTISFDVPADHIHTLTDTNIQGTLPISKGGTNNTTYTNNELLLFNGTSITSSGKLITDFANAVHTHSSYINQNAFSNVLVGATTISADSITDTLELIAGTSITLTPNATNDSITINSSDTNFYLSGLGFNTGTGLLTGTMTGTSDKTVNLDGRYSLTTHTHSSYINQNSFSNVNAITSGNSLIGTVSSSSATDTWSLKEGTDIDLQVDGVNKRITVNALSQSKTIKHTITLFKGGSVSTAGYQQPYVMSSYTGTITGIRYRCNSGSGTISVRNQANVISTLTCDTTWRYANTGLSNTSLTAGINDLRLYCNATGQQDIIIQVEVAVVY